MPEGSSLLHTALGTGTLCGTNFVGPAAGLVRTDEVVDRSLIMKWETPAAAEIRFGFEITMYVANR
jgi:pyrroloquinoline quinone biosynthesis protein A